MVAVNPADHVGLVWTIAHSYARRANHPVEDLVGEGTIGLMQAVRKYDPAFGTRFSTYAGLWIHSYIGKYLNEGNRLIAMPPKVLRAARKAGVLLGAPLSIDASLGNSSKKPDQREPKSWHDVLADDSPNPEDQAAKKEESEILWHAVGKLPKRTRTILRMRFVLGQSLDAIGQVFGVSRERIRQIEAEGLRELRKQLDGVL